MVVVIVVATPTTPAPVRVVMVREIAGYVMERAIVKNAVVVAIIR